MQAQPNQSLPLPSGHPRSIHGEYRPTGRLISIPPCHPHRCLLSHSLSLSHPTSTNNDNVYRVRVPSRVQPVCVCVFCAYTCEYTYTCIINATETMCMRVRGGLFRSSPFTCAYNDANVFARRRDIESPLQRWWGGSGELRTKKKERRGDAFLHNRKHDVAQTQTRFQESRQYSPINMPYL